MAEFPKVGQVSQRQDKSSEQGSKGGEFGRVLLMALRRTAYSLLGLAAILLIIGGGLVLWSRSVMTGAL